MLTGSHGNWVIVLSFLVALVLSIVPLPVWALVFRPAWVCLVLIYWCLALPDRVGIGIGWLVGLLLDVLTDSLLGQHALSLTVVAFLTLKLYRPIRIWPVWLQALVVLLLVGVGQMLGMWVKGVSGNPPWSLAYFLPSIASMLVWPAMFAVLRVLRRRFISMDTGAI